MGDLKMQIAFANLLRKKAEHARAATPGDTANRARTVPVQASAAGPQKRAGRSPRKTGSIRPKR